MRKLFIALVILLLLAGIAVYSALSWQERNVTYLSYSLLNSLENVEFDEVDELLVPYLSQSFWDVDLPSIKQELEEIPWVAQASIGRSWPATLTISLTEHKPFARWSSKGLITQKGIIFMPKDTSAFANLIALDGDSLQASTVLKVLGGLQGIFQKLSAEEWQVKKLAQQADGVLRVEFTSEQFLIVDEANWQEKLERFLKAYPKLPEKLVKSAHSFDLRYSNGLAIKPFASPLVQEIQDE